MRGNSCWRILCLIALLGVHGGLAVSSMHQKSATYDEIYFVTAGYRYWQADDYRLNPEAGNWLQRWVALPLTAMTLSYPDTSDTDVIQAGHDFFYTAGNPSRTMIDRARLMIVLVSLAIGLAVFVLASRYFSPMAGWIALGFYAFSPSILAHARLATSDLALAGCLLVAADQGWRMLDRITPLRVFGVALSATAAVLVKLTGLILLPLMAVMVAIRTLDNRPMTVVFFKRHALFRFRWQKFGSAMGAVAVAVLIGVVLIWASYGWRYEATSDVPYESEWIVSDAKMPPLVAICAEYRLLPEAFLGGIARIAIDADARPAFLNGRYSTSGWWYFFPAAMAMKTPLLTLFLTVFCGIWAMTSGWQLGGWHQRLPFWLLPSLVMVAAMASHMNIGVRYILGVYPPLFICLGGAIAHGLARLTARQAGMGLLAIGCVVVVETQGVWPHYLAYFNSLAGGPASGYRRLVDSSLDWGQDLPALKRYLDQQPGQHPVFISYFGSTDPAVYDIRGVHFSSRGYHWLSGKPFVGPTRTYLPGTYIISATDLAQVYGVYGGWNVKDEHRYIQATDRIRAFRTRRGSDGVVPPALALSYTRLRHARLCAYLRSRIPDAQIGYSILVYRLDASDLKRALTGPLPPPIRQD